MLVKRKLTKPLNIYIGVSGFCHARFGVLFCSVVLGCRHTPQTTGPCSQWFPFSNWGLFECDSAHRRSVAVLCMLHKIRCNPIHPYYGALPVPYVPVRVLCGPLVAHRYAPPRCKIPCPCRTILLALYSMVWD